jgi:P27 family predicted phage terminase small subunit
MNEPKFSGTPTCPRHLNKGARAEWKRISAELSASGLLTNVDRAALAAYCSSYARWAEAEENVQKFGTVIKSPKSGFPIQNPYVGVANTALEQMRRWAVEFGMTPSSRSRIHVENSGGSGGNEDAFTNFMRGIGGMDEAEDTHEDIEAEQLQQSGTPIRP